MDLTPKQQASEAIRQAQAILIVTGQRPNVDQVASMVAVSLILRKFGKKVTAVVTDQMPGSVSLITQGQIERNLAGNRDFIVRVDMAHAEVDKLKYTIENGKLNIAITPFNGGFSQQDVSFGHGEYHYDLIIAMGVVSRHKLDRVFEQNAGLLQSTPILNMDFHRINESYGAINLVDTNAATLSEMLISLSESLQPGMLDEPIATAMLTGIIAATDRFSAPHTTAKSMTVAAQLMAAGAKQQQIIKSLYSGGSHQSGSRDGGSHNSGSRDSGSNRDGRDRDKHIEKVAERPAQTTERRASEQMPAAAESSMVSTVEQPAPINSPYAVPGTLPNSSDLAVYKSIEPISASAIEAKKDVDTGPDLAAIDWNAVMPHVPTVAPNVNSSFDAPHQIIEAQQLSDQNS